MQCWRNAFILHSNVDPILLLEGLTFKLQSGKNYKSLLVLNFGISENFYSQLFKADKRGRFP